MTVVAATNLRARTTRRSLRRIYQRSLGAAAGLLLAAAAFAGTAQATSLVVEGAGWGHGIGMSQWGAAGYAAHGWSDRQILAHYYSGTALGSVAPSAKIKVLVGTRVLTLPIETYVRGVVAAEMPASWPMAALESQAIASRTFALTSDVGGSRFDVYSDTRSQMYLGRAAETPRSNAAVAATAGQIVTYHGNPITTYFFASSGGYTESIQNAWPGASPAPWLKGVEDRYEAPSNRWRVSYSFARVQSLLSGLVRGRFTGIEVLRRGVSPRIVLARIRGSAGVTKVTGAELEERLGLMSSWAYFSVRRGASVLHERDFSNWHRPGAAPVPVTSSTPPDNGGAPRGGGVQIP